MKCCTSQRLPFDAFLLRLTRPRAAVVPLRIHVATPHAAVPAATRLAMITDIWREGVCERLAAETCRDIEIAVFHAFRTKRVAFRGARSLTRTFPRRFRKISLRATHRQSKVAIPCFPNVTSRSNEVS